MVATGAKFRVILPQDNLNYQFNNDLWSADYILFVLLWHTFFCFAVSCYSLFPLLFENQEYPIKVMLLLTYATLMWVGFSSHFAAKSPQEGKKVNESGGVVRKNSFIGWISFSYLLGIVAIELWSQVFHHYVFGSRFPFLPLIMVSLYCGVGMMYSWMWQLAWIVRH